MPTVKLILGLPGSGKTTRAKALVASDPSYVRVNRDDLREMLSGGIYDPKIEKIVKELHTQAIVSASRPDNKFNIVIDDAGLLNPKTRAEIEDAIKFCGGALIEIEIIDTPIEECIRRDSLREKPVGEAVIRNFHHKYGSTIYGESQC